LQLTIEKLIYGGDGLARLPADEKGTGKAAFVPFTLPGETVEAAPIEEKPGYVRATATSILSPSAHRIAAPCPYFQRCGGCHYQHAGYDDQLSFKAEILKETLRRLAKIDLSPIVQVHPSPPWNYRNRTRLHVRAGAAFQAGFLKSGSHELLAVRECPISSPLLNRAITALWKLGEAGQVPEWLNEIEFFANADDSQLQIELYGDPQGLPTEFPKVAEQLRVELPEIISACAFGRTRASERGGKLQVKDEPEWTAGPGEFRYMTAAGPLRVSGGSFFQVNRFLIEEMVRLVVDRHSGELALDLYAGAGLFSLALAPSFRHIVAVESSHSSAGDLKYNAIRNVKAVRSTVEEYLTGRGAKVRPDLVVVDPPRAGLGQRVAQALARIGAPRLTYVSCDPATLARDLVSLMSGGYRLQQVHMIDLFPQTFHIETIVELAQ
jgi:23S rRNA (uracil1939-C5)-methyltransferase